VLLFGLAAAIAMSVVEIGPLTLEFWKMLPTTIEL